MKAISCVMLCLLMGSSFALRITTQSSPTEHLMKQMEDLKKQYLYTVRMGLLGGLIHGAYTDLNRGGTTDPNVRNECLTKVFWHPDQGPLDICIAKWDANERLSQVEMLYHRIKEQQIPGDLMECGVWRGGMTIYMKALLRANGDEGRNVWVSDSFNGVPDAVRQQTAPGYDKIPTWEKELDINQWGGHVDEVGTDGQQKMKNILTVEQEFVRDNFARFQLLDAGVKFLPGYFNESLPNAAQQGIKQLALLRVDGDLYSSTMDVLDNLYHLVSPGGYVIFDDWPLPQSQRAIRDFFKKVGLSEDIIKKDRVTPETLYLGKEDNINVYAYFQKPM